MVEMIPSDFDVELVARSEHSSLFAALRPDVWHFVLATASNVSSNYQSIDIAQFHWPRYSVAREIAALDGIVEKPPQKWRLGFAIDDGIMSIQLNAIRYGLPDELACALRQDAPLLRRAIGKVKETEKGFEVIRAKTFRSNPVITEQKSVADAISFERETRGKLDPTDFGAYSAFCTWRDFIVANPNTREEIAGGTASEMVTWDPTSFGDEPYWNSVFDIQEQLYGQRIWGPGVDCDVDTLRGAFLASFQRLSSIQFAQFVLMNGMHRGGPFHPLATLFDLMDFNSYKTWRTREFQPDSLEEQEIRTHSSFIELLGLTD